MADKPVSLLGDDDSDDYPEDSFRVNKAFSGHYDTWRQKEEMQKLKDLKKDMSDSSSSESESEEEPVIEKDFLKALSMLKSDDPRIYSEDVELFKEEEEVKEKRKVKKEKPMFVKDFERELVLNRNGEFSDEEEPKSGFNEVEPPSISKEEFKQRKAELSNLVAMEDSDDDDFKERKKEKVEEEMMTVDYLQFLKGQKEEIKEGDEELSFLHKYWNNPKLDDGEKFLRDYILNEKFVVKDKSDINTTYSSEMAGDAATLSDEEEMLKQQELFEHKYNFRFEEPDTEFIKRYPRTIGDSLRREDNRRKQKREEYTERKKKEKEQKKEELKRLKALKRKEIEEKFLKLKEVCGQDELNLDEEDMDSDFDPDKHDRKMKELFNDDYYAVAEEQKPEFEYDEDLDDEKWDVWTRDNNKANGKEIDEDCEVDESSEDENIKDVDAKDTFQQEMVDSTRVGRKKGKKKSLFATIISQPKPVFDPEGKSFDDYLDEYYKMDFEDVVGDLPVRFKYRKVVPNDFGLSVDEILAANDKELNRWCSVKKTCQYRHEDEEKYDVQAFQKKAQIPALKQKVLPSVYSAPNEGEEAQAGNDASQEEGTKKKRRRKKKKKGSEVSGEKNKNESLVEENDKDNMQDSIPLEYSLEDNTESKKSKKKSNSPQKSSIIASPSQNENKNLLSEEMSASTSNVAIESETLKKKSKRKRKKANGSTVNFEISELENSGVNSEVLEQQKSSIMASPSQSENKNLLSEEMSASTSNVAIESETLKKKSKRKRKKANGSTVNFEISELENSGVNSLPSIYQLSDDAANTSQNEASLGNLGSNSASPNNKGTAKRKLEHSMDSGNSDDSHVKKKKRHSEGIEFTESDHHTQQHANTDPASVQIPNVSHTPKKSKKRKKKSKNKQDGANKKPFNQDFHKKNFASSSKLQNNAPESDKKLALPNSRLASYGINPKKFKNTIIYSK
ncbi:hypothetical protein JTE90_017669 [Oedothorax gibbosus]|uniref:Protein KRI1 homolog n=1 Tax=Oedothorax gibbosus TaxID=931172 RepID=A0AAV6UF36_9ARAC|nr:hypothetical protein JTE90_017669 [Oedothorax gibbosus]